MKRIVCLLFFAIVVLSGCLEGGKVQPSLTPAQIEGNQNQTPRNTPIPTFSPSPPTPPQPPMPHIPPGHTELAGEEREEAINLVLNNTKVKEWLEDGYKIVNVTKSNDDEMVWVCILTQKQILPWIVGITIKVPVDLKNKRAQGEVINFEVALASLTEEQKEKTEKIALSDPNVKERIGDDYEVTGVGVMAYSYCYMGCYPKAYPAVFIKSNPEPCRYGMDFAVLIDLKEEKVADILSHYRKPSPECLNSG